MTHTVKNPKPGRCIAEVQDSSGWHWSQCPNKRKYGDWCGVHSPEAQARRKAKSEAAHQAWRKRVDAPALERERLETVNEALLAALEGLLAHPTLGYFALNNMPEADYQDFMARKAVADTAIEAAKKS